MKNKENSNYDNWITHPNTENNYLCGLLELMALRIIFKNKAEAIINQLIY